jgi:heat shock protein HtpX
MFFESLEPVTRWLHIELMEVLIPGGAEEAQHFVSFFFTLNVALTAIGVVSAAVVALFLRVRKTRLPLAQLFPEMEFVSAPTELVNSVARLSRKIGVTTPGVSLIDSGNAAAFITQSKQGLVLAISVGLVESLSMDELDACIAHELSHVKNNDFALRSFATSARVAMFAHPLSHLVEPALYRAREFLADKRAAQLVGNSHSLISALSKIGESQDYIHAQSGTIVAACLLNSASENRFFRLFDRHPSIEARIEALKELTPFE